MDALKADNSSASRAALRMRLHRERKRSGLRCLNIELRDSEIAALIKAGLLVEQHRGDPSAIADALYAHFERTLI